MTKRQPNTEVASVHRFHDKVAVFVGDGQTTYLSEVQARRLAKALYDCARSVRTEPKFSSSNFATVSIPQGT